MSDPNNVSQSDIDTASNRVDANKTLSLLANMLPRVLASDERDARHYSASQKRWQGVPFNRHEIEQELKTFLLHLAMQLTQAVAGESKVLSTPRRALVYIERSAFYALEDYQYAAEQDPHMKCLWDILRVVEQDARDGCQLEPQESSWTLVIAIQQTLKNAGHDITRPKSDAIDNDAYS